LCRFLLEDCDRVKTPVRNKEPYFKVDPVFEKASYSKRYELLVRRLVLERVYTAACLVMATNSLHSRITQPAEDLNFQRFVAALRGICWSGGVYPELLPDGTKLCMLNPLQSPGRSRITLTEEICHCYFGHQPTAFVVNAQGLLVRDFNKKQEEEAYGVGAAVLLPWNLFFPLLNKGTGVEDLAEGFDVTTQLVEYRIKITGASALYRSRQLKLHQQPTSTTHISLVVSGDEIKLGTSG
jgi:hypothetical protein